MKSTVLFILISALSSIVATAQTTITSSTHGHQIGDVVVWHNTNVPVNAVDPGEEGPDQIWDFSTFTTNYTFSNEYVDPANTPFAAQASGSNIAVYHNIVNNDAYTFCQMNNQQMSHTGGGWTESGGQLYYDLTDPAIVQVYPFSYEDVFSDSYSYSIDYNQLGYDMVVQISGTLTMEADAWGTITTALGTYGNALRVKEIYSESVSTYIDGQLISTNAALETFYKWYAPNKRAAVFEYHFIAGDEMSHSIMYSDNTVGMNEVNINSVEVYPNPAKNTLRINWKPRENVRCLSVLNSIGQHVYQSSTVSCPFSIDVGNLNEGLYIVQITMTNGQEVRKKVIVQH